MGLGLRVLRFIRVYRGLYGLRVEGRALRVLRFKDSLIGASSSPPVALMLRGSTGCRRW